MLSGVVLNGRGVYVMGTASKGKAQDSKCIYHGIYFVKSLDNTSSIVCALCLVTFAIYAF